MQALSGVGREENAVWVPIVESAADWQRQIELVLEAVRSRQPQSSRYAIAPALLVRGLGLVTWGETCTDAKRHTEVLEALLEVTGRFHSASGRLPSTSSRPIFNTDSSREEGGRALRLVNG